MQNQHMLRYLCNSASRKNRMATVLVDAAILGTCRVAEEGVAEKGSPAGRLPRSAAESYPCEAMVIGLLGACGRESL